MMKPTMEKNDLIRRSALYKFFDGGSGVARLHVADIDTLPAVDAVPVVHGKWLNSVAGEKIIKCSKCKTQYYVGATKENTKQYKFCPNCGARMDGKDDDNENR